jgi:hypothetical protein
MTRELFLLVVLALGAESVSAAFVDFATLPDGTPVASNTPITNQYQSVGVSFQGLRNPEVFSGPVFFGSGRSERGLTHSVYGTAFEPNGSSWC